MATRGRARKSKVRLLVVRGKGDEIYITLAPSPVSDAKLANIIDQYAKRSRGVTKAADAFFMEGDVRVLRLAGEQLCNLRPPRHGK